MSFIISNALKQICLQAAGLVHVCILTLKIKPPEIYIGGNGMKCLMTYGMSSYEMQKAMIVSGIIACILRTGQSLIFFILPSSRLVCLCVIAGEHLLQLYGHNYPDLDFTNSNIVSGLLS